MNLTISQKRRRYYFGDGEVNRRPAKWTDKTLAAWHAAWEVEDFETMERLERRARVAYWIETVVQGIGVSVALTVLSAMVYALMALSAIE